MTITKDNGFDYVRAPIAYYRIHPEQLTQKQSLICTKEEIQVVLSFLNLEKQINGKSLWRLAILFLKLIYKKYFRRN